MISVDFKRGVVRIGGSGPVAGFSPEVSLEVNRSIPHQDRGDGPPA